MKKMLDGVNIMFDKKFSLILLMLVFILSISAVSAVDANATDDVMTIDADEEPPSGISEDVSTNENLTASSTTSAYSMDADDVEMRYKGLDKYTGVLTKNGQPLKNVTVKFWVDGEYITQNTNKNGKVTFSLYNLRPGTYKVSLSYGHSATSKNTITVKPLVEANDITVIYNSNSKFYATFYNRDGTPLAHQDITFRFKGYTNNHTRTTNSKGVATLSLHLNVGTYTIISPNPKGQTISNKIIVKSSVLTSNLEKHYLSSKVFSAKFLNVDGKPLANTNIQYYTDDYHTIKTNENGFAKIPIDFLPGEYTIKVTNPITGETKTNNIKVLPSIDAPDTVTTFAGVSSNYKLTLYTSESLAKNKNMNVYVDGTKKTVQTNANGVATVTFKFASQGTYYIKAVDPRTGYSFTTKVIVKRPSITASDVTTVAGISTTFTAHLLDQSGNSAIYTPMKITINGVAKTVTTDSKGAATYTFKLSKGTYNAVCEDLSTGYILTKKITVLSADTAIYDKNGVSLDGKTLLVIGRPSTASEERQYGYTFYKTKIDRTCSYCGGHNLYWSIFFAGNEYSNWGKFPATGNSEGGSAEGIIICADCDSDWSVFGHNHGGGGGDLTVISGPVKTTKQDAYDLLEGNYVAT